MVDLVLSFVAGSVATAWVFYLRSREEKWARRPEAAIFRDLEEKNKKPDLAKAKYYQSARFRNDKAFCEKMKKGES